jgi:hypothetical protein
MPCKPTKSNGGRTRNLPGHAPDKWEEFKAYNMRDVEAEQSIKGRLSKFQVPESEWKNYILDQEINDRGIGWTGSLCAVLSIATVNTVKRILPKRGADRSGQPEFDPAAQRLAKRKWPDRRLLIQIRRLRAAFRSGRQCKTGSPAPPRAGQVQREEIRRHGAGGLQG